MAGSAATVASSAVAGSAATVASAGVVSSAATVASTAVAGSIATAGSARCRRKYCHRDVTRGRWEHRMCGVCALQALYRLPGLRRLHKLRRVCGVLQLLGLALCRRAPRRARLSQPTPEARMRRNQPVSESIRPPVTAPDSTVARTEDPAAASTWQMTSPRRAFAP